MRFQLTILRPKSEVHLFQHFTVLVKKLTKGSECLLLSCFFYVVNRCASLSSQILRETRKDRRGSGSSALFPPLLLNRMRVLLGVISRGSIIAFLFVSFHPPRAVRVDSAVMLCRLRNFCWILGLLVQEVSWYMYWRSGAMRAVFSCDRPCEKLKLSVPYLGWPSIFILYFIYKFFGRFKQIGP